MGQTKVKVYRLVFEDGKQYVGRTIQTMSDRMCGHRADAKRYNTPVNIALRSLSYEMEVLSEHSTVKQANAEEIRLIAEGKLQDERFGYNAFAGNVSGQGLRESTRLKMSKVHSNLRKSTLLKMSKARKGKPIPREQVVRMVKTRMSKVNSADLVYDYETLGLRVCEISRKRDVPYSTVRRRLRNEGVYNNGKS